MVDEGSVAVSSSVDDVASASPLAISVVDEFGGHDGDSASLVSSCPSFGSALLSFSASSRLKRSSSAFF